jgi:hypothetical protein
MSDLSFGEVLIIKYRLLNNGLARSTVLYHLVAELRCGLARNSMKRHHL